MILGPLISEAALAKVERHIEDAVEQGAEVIEGGQRSNLGGTFFRPTVLTGAKPGMAVAKEETFGPLAPLFKFEEEADVVAMANDSEFGLAAYFYSRDLARVWRVAERLETGMVGINTGLISPRWRRSAASSNRGWAGKDRSTGSRISWS